MTTPPPPSVEELNDTTKFEKITIDLYNINQRRAHIPFKPGQLYYYYDRYNPNEVFSGYYSGPYYVASEDSMGSATRYGTHTNTLYEREGFEFYNLVEGKWFGHTMKKIQIPDSKMSEPYYFYTPKSSGGKKTRKSKKSKKSSRRQKRTRKH